MLLIDAFHSKADELVLVLVDLPHENLGVSYLWRSRRESAATLRSVFARLDETLDFVVLIILSYPETGNHNAQIPEYGVMGSEQVRLGDIFQEANIVVAITGHSATAHLIDTIHSCHLSEVPACAWSTKR